jgi:hypothetical protein
VRTPGAVTLGTMRNWSGALPDHRGIEVYFVSRCDNDYASVGREYLGAGCA